MKEEDIKKYKHSISKLNEIRRKYWSQLQGLRKRTYSSL